MTDTFRQLCAVGAMVYVCSYNGEVPVIIRNESYGVVVYFGMVNFR